MEPSKCGARVPRAVAVMAGLLERAAERGDAEGEGAGAAPASSSAFRGKALPVISVQRYAERIYRYAGCSPACFVVAYVYLDRLAQQQRERTPLVDDVDEEETAVAAEAATVGVVVDSYSVHRLLITAVMVAAKFMDDKHYNNAYFARVGGVEVAEMNGLELELLFALRFRLNVTPDTFARYCAALEAHMLVPTPAAAAAAAPVLDSGEDQEETERRHRRDHQQQSALLLVTKTNQDAAVVTAAVHGGGGSSVPPVAVVVVPRAAVEMVAR